MIAEIDNYIESLDEQVFTWNVKPSEGLHVLVDVDDQGKITGHHIRRYKKGEDTDHILEKCALLQQHVPMVNAHKSLDAPAKKIHSANPFALSFKKDTDLEKVLERMAVYFPRAQAYLPDDSEENDLKVLASAFEDFCKGDLIDVLKSSEDYNHTKKTNYIHVYLNLEEEQFKSIHENYLKDKLFNTNDHNSNQENGEVAGISDFNNGFNTKKPFLRHQTAAFTVSGFVTQRQAKNVHRFQQLQRRRIFLNPQPLFIDNREVNNQSCKFVRNNIDNVESRSQLLERFFEQHKDRLYNFYLLYWMGGELVDLDYVGNFRYYFRLSKNPEKQWNIKNLFGGEEKQLNTVFDFEYHVVRELFDGAVVSWKGTSKKYFEEIQAQYCKSDKIYINALKYRKACYDFIYKSRFQAITAQAFKELLLTGLREAIRLDKEYNETQSIRNKLNIWFSLNDFFDPQNKNFNGVPMATKLPEFREHIQKITESDDAHFDSDEMFAYGAGQLIYFLLTQSETSNKSHALFEPFLQPNDVEQFKRQITNVFEKYKHAIHLNAKSFNRVLAEVQAFQTNRKMNDLQAPLIAGYADQNFMFRKKEDQ